MKPNPFGFMAKEMGGLLYLVKTHAMGFLNILHHAFTTLKAPFKMQLSNFKMTRSRD